MYVLPFPPPVPDCGDDIDNSLNNLGGATSLPVEHCHAKALQEIPGLEDAGGATHTGSMNSLYGNVLIEIRMGMFLGS